MENTLRDSVTFRTRTAARKWRDAFLAKTGVHLMTRRELDKDIFSRTSVVWVLEIPTEGIDAARTFFPASIINQ